MTQPMKKQKPKIIDEIRSKKALEVLANAAEATDGLVDKMNESFLQNQNEEFYQGLFCAYDYAAEIGFKYIPETDKTSELSQVTTYIAYVLTENQFTPRELPENGRFIYDKPIKEKEIVFLTNTKGNMPHDIIKTLNKAFKGNKSPDFYKGLLSGLNNAHSIIQTVDTQAPNKEVEAEFLLQESLMYVASRVADGII